MRNKNVHRYIEEQNSEAKENLRKMTEKKLGFALSQETISDSEKKTLKAQKWVAIFATAACVICLLIALPFILRNFRELDDKTRYCKEEDYTWIWSDCNIKEYNQKHGENLLYIDLYEYTAEVQTQLYVSKSDVNDIIFFYEQLFLEDTYDEINLYITDNRTTVDILVGIEESCKNTDYVNDVLVQWMCEIDSGAIVFEYKGYKYFVTLEYSIEEEELKRIVADML